jgi:hypothetical protein
VSTPTTSKVPDRARPGKPTPRSTTAGPSPLVAPLAEAIVDARDHDVCCEWRNGSMFGAPRRGATPSSPDGVALPLLRVLARVALAVAEREVQMEKRAS